MSSLEDFAGKLESPEEAERVYAAEDLGYLNDPAVVPVLLDRLPRESAPPVQAAIFQALSRIDGEAVIQGCVALLADEDPGIRNHAVAILRRRVAPTIPFLAEAMRQGGPHLRKLVLDVLQGAQAGGATEIHAAALSDQDPNVVITAVEYLGQIRADQFRGRIEELLQTADHPMLIAACLEALVGIGKESSLAAILRRFPDLATAPDFLVASLLKALAEFGSTEEFSRVAGLLPQRGPHLRPAIVTALLALQQRARPVAPPGELVSDLSGLAGGADPPLVRYQAVLIVGAWAEREDVTSFLLSCLGSPERLVRLGAVESLRACHRPDLSQLLAAHVPEEIDEEVLQALACPPQNHD